MCSSGGGRTGGCVRARSGSIGPLQWLPRRVWSCCWCLAGVGARGAPVGSCCTLVRSAPSSLPVHCCRLVGQEVLRIAGWETNGVVVCRRRCILPMVVWEAWRCCGHVEEMVVDGGRGMAPLRCCLLSWEMNGLRGVASSRGRMASAWVAYSQGEMNGTTADGCILRPVGGRGKKFGNTSS